MSDRWLMALAIACLPVVYVGLSFIPTNAGAGMSLILGGGSAAIASLAVLMWREWIKDGDQ